MQLENSTDFVKTEPSEILKKRPKQRERETTSAGEKDEIDEDRQILPQSKRQKRERASSKTKADQIVSGKAEFIVISDYLLFLLKNLLNSFFLFIDAC